MTTSRRAILCTALLAACGADPVPTLLEPPAHGVQLVFGPFAVPRVGTQLDDGTIATGEVQLCWTRKLPNDAPMAIDQIDVKMNLGSHHFILFRSEKDFPDAVFPCWGVINFDDWQFMFDTNRAGGLAEPWKLGPGQAFVLAPHQQVMMQAHFVNATTVQTPLAGLVYANLYASSDPVQHEIQGMFTVNTRLEIPPHTPFMGYSSGRTCTFNQNATLVAMTGHFHARGDLFSVHRVSQLGATSYDFGEIYRSPSWDAPTFEVFGDNPPLNIAAPEGLYFRCYYHNDSDQTIGFGGHADVQEHCNLFFQYYKDDPAYPQPLRCMEGPGGW